MDYDQLESFVVLCETESITRTSEILFRTQPTISTRIKNLEQELGYKLINRTPGKRNITVTAKGLAFLPYARDLMNLYREVETSNEAQRNALIISSVSSVKVPILTDIGRSLTQDHGTKINLLTHQSETAYKMVADREVDAAFVSYDWNVPGVHCEKVFTQGFFAAVYSDTPDKSLEVAGLSEINPTDLDTSREIHWSWNSDYERWYERSFGKPNYLIEVDSYEMMREFLDTEGAWAVLQEQVAAELSRQIPLKFFAFRDAPPARDIYLITSSYPDKNNLKILRTFERYVRDYAVRHSLSPDRL